MSRGASSEPGTVELNLTLPGGVRVAIFAPSSSASLATQVFNHVAAFQPEGPETSEFELISAGPSSPVGLASRLRAPETRDQIRHSFAPCPSRLLGLGARLCGSSLSGRARVERAWLCGQWAAAVKAQRIHSPDRTPAIDLKSRFYAVLGAPGLSQPTIFRSSRGYWDCIGHLEDSPSISQAFPSEAEAKIYLESAGAIEFDFAP